MAVLVSRCTRAAANIALEHWLLAHGPATPALLLWRNDPAVVLGRHQDAAHELDAPAALAQRVSVVRRFSGGGCVYHVGYQNCAC